VVGGAYFWGMIGGIPRTPAGGAKTV